MKKITKLVLGAFAVLALAPTMNAQRFLTEVFPTVNITMNDSFGGNYSVLTGTPKMSKLSMDVYQPSGDVATKRPLIILLHAGSYLPKGTNQLPFGDKSDSTIIELCNRFAKRGWVAVSMNYRLGWNPLASTQEAKAKGIIQAVYRSMQDAKACIRFFKKDAAGSNVYKVDTTQIVLGGDNSGGYTVLAAAALNKVPELSYPKFLDGANQPFVSQAAWGDFDGNNGLYSYYSNPGHSSNFQMVLNLGGAMGDTLWQEVGEIPMVAFHGVADPLTPYGTGIVTVASTGDPIIEVSGSGDFSKTADRLGNQAPMAGTYTDAYSVKAATLTSVKGLYPFYGAANGFEPWAWYNKNDPFIANGNTINPLNSKARASLYMDTIMGFFSPRAVAALGLDITTGIQEKDVKALVSISPVPAVDGINISSSLPVNKVQMFDIVGKVILNRENLNDTNVRIDRAQLPAGLYFVSLQIGKEQVVRKVIFH